MSRAAQAREQVGLSIDQAAKKLRISVRYLQQIEHHGSPSYSTALRVSALYHCPADIFLKGGETLAGDFRRGRQ